MYEESRVTQCIPPFKHLTAVENHDPLCTYKRETHPRSVF